MEFFDNKKKELKWKIIQMNKTEKKKTSTFYLFLLFVRSFVCWENDS